MIIRQTSEYSKLHNHADEEFNYSFLIERQNGEMFIHNEKVRNCYFTTVDYLPYLERQNTLFSFTYNDEVTDDN